MLYVNVIARMPGKKVSPASAFIPVVNCVNPASAFWHQGQSGAVDHRLVSQMLKPLS
jgi:hypothetical protein